MSFYSSAWYDNEWERYKLGLSSIYDRPYYYYERPYYFDHLTYEERLAYWRRHYDYLDRTVVYDPVYEYVPVASRRYASPVRARTARALELEADLAASRARARYYSPVRRTYL